MSQEAFLAKATQPDFQFHPVVIQGGSAAVTKLQGTGVSIAYVSTGIVDITWSEAQGNTTYGICGFGFHTAAGAQAALKGYTIVDGAQSAQVTASGPFTIRINITNSSQALADLTVAQSVTLLFGFRQHGAPAV